MTDKPLSPTERAKKILNEVLRGPEPSKAMIDWVAAEIESACEEAIKAFIVEATDNDPRVAPTKRKWMEKAYEDAAKIARAQECSCETCPEQISRKLRVKAGEK